VWPFPFKSIIIKFRVLRVHAGRRSSKVKREVSKWERPTREEGANVESGH